MGPTALLPLRRGFKKNLEFYLQYFIIYQPVLVKHRDDFNFHLYLLPL